MTAESSVAASAVMAMNQVTANDVTVLIASLVFAVLFVGLCIAAAWLGNETHKMWNGE